MTTTQLNPYQLANAKKFYQRDIDNAKRVQKVLKKSWMWNNFLESVNYIIDNYTLEDSIDKWLRDYCHENKITSFSCGYIARPFKIKSFREWELQKVKNALDEGAEYSDYTYGSYDYSIHVNGKEKKGRYSAEYKWCGNGHYYILLDYDTALFLEDD